jgi:hypothetical protein
VSSIGLVVSKRFSLQPAMAAFLAQVRAEARSRAGGRSLA